MYLRTDAIHVTHRLPLKPHHTPDSLLRHRAGFDAPYKIKQTHAHHLPAQWGVQHIHALILVMLLAASATIWTLLKARESPSISLGLAATLQHCSC